MLEDRLNKFIDQAKLVLGFDEYLEFLDSMYLIYRVCFIDKAELYQLHIAMRCYNEAGEIREAQQNAI